MQAKKRKHLAGEGINAQVSLKMPSHSAFEQLVVNVHWTELM